MPPTVLVAWDPASADRSAVAFGLLLARPLRARVLVAGVASPADELAGVEGDEAPDPPRALAGLAQQLRRVPQAELRLVRAASPAAGLLSLIESEGPAFTVLGSGRGAPHGRARAGATAGRVLHGATGPVVLVPRGHAGGLGPIAVGLLPTPDGLRALRLGAGLAASARVPVRVITVLRRSPEPAAARALADRVAPGAGGDLGRAITAAARRTAAIAVEPQVLVGDAADALLRATGRAAMLVLGSRAYGPAGIVLPGGAATAVLGSARCPVALAPRAAA